MSYFSPLLNKAIQILVISTAQILISSGFPVHAQTPAESKPTVAVPPWEFYDTDKDDYISAEEAAAQKMPPEIFKTLDVDRDGSLNKDEFSKAPPVQRN